MRRKFRHFVVGLMVLGLAFGMTGLAGAVSVTLVDGDWANAQYQALTTAHSINNSGTTGGLSTIYWGAPATSAGQSGYRFQSVSTPFDAVADGSVFALGEFTHANFPIYALNASIPGSGSLTSVDLIINLGITGLDPFSVTFAFSHNETTNTNDPLASRDIVTLVNPIVNKEFTDGSYNYYFNLLGFSQNSGNTIDTQFLTYESQNNIANLYATITSSPVGVPEPLTLLLLGLGLVGVAGVRRKVK